MTLVLINEANIINHGPAEHIYMVNHYLINCILRTSYVTMQIAW